MDMFISLREAADLAGVSRPTLFRAVQRGELLIKTENSGKSRRILVSRESLSAWTCSREQPSVQPSEQTEQINEQPEQQQISELVPLIAHLDLVRILEETQLRLLDVTERAHRAERQGDLMRMELMATRNCLTEQADSLFEKQATMKQKEEILEESRRQQADWEQERAKLEEENEARLAAFEQEKADLVERLKMSESRVSWMEQRVPRWVRSLFRAG